MQLILQCFQLFLLAIVLSSGEASSKKWTWKSGINSVGSLMHKNAEKIGVGTAVACFAMSRDVQHAKLKWRTAAKIFTSLGALDFSDVGPWSKLSSKFHSWGRVLSNVDSNIEAKLKKQMQAAMSTIVIDLAEALTEVGTSNGIDSATRKETIAFATKVTKVLLVNWSPKWVDKEINDFGVFLEKWSSRLNEILGENWNATWARNEASWLAENAHSEWARKLAASWGEIINDQWDANWVKQKFIETINEVDWKKFLNGKLLLWDLPLID